MLQIVNKTEIILSKTGKEYIKCLLTDDKNHKSKEFLFFKALNPRIFDTVVSGLVTTLKGSIVSYKNIDVVLLDGSDLEKSYEFQKNFSPSISFDGNSNEVEDIVLIEHSVGRFFLYLSCKSGEIENIKSFVINYLKSWRVGDYQIISICKELFPNRSDRYLVLYSFHEDRVNV